MSTERPVLLLTRPRADADRFLAALGPVRARVVVSPVTEIVPIEAEPLPDRVAGVILTSANAVHAASPGLTAWCVGDRTAEAARDAGLVPRSAGGDAADLLALILAERPAGPLVHLRGTHVAADIAGPLREAGLDVAERVVYRQEARPLSAEALAALDGAAPVVLPVFSPRSARALAAAAGRAAPRHVVAMSPAVARAAAALAPASITVAEEPTLSAMVRTTTERTASL